MLGSLAERSDRLVDKIPDRLFINTHNSGNFFNTEILKISQRDYFNLSFGKLWKHLLNPSWNHRIRLMLDQQRFRVDITMRHFPIGQHRQLFCDRKFIWGHVNSSSQGSVKVKFYRDNIFSKRWPQPPDINKYFLYGIFHNRGIAGQLAPVIIQRTVVSFENERISLLISVSYTRPELLVRRFQNEGFRSGQYLIIF